MTYPAALLPDLLVGWQKVADRYKIPIYVFQTGDTYHAVSNETQVACKDPAGVGVELSFETAEEDPLSLYSPQAC